MDPTQLEREQEATGAAIEAAIVSAEQRLAALDQNLKAEILQQREEAIRAQVLEAVRPRRKAMAERAEQAKALLRRHTPEAVRRAALDGLDGTTRLATFATLSRSSTAELVDRLQDAIDAGNVAVAEAIRLEFQTREPDERKSVNERFVELFGSLRAPEADEANRALNRTAGLLDIVDVRLTELMRGRSDPMKRLAAHRAAGNRAA